MYGFVDAATNINACFEPLAEGLLGQERSSFGPFSGSLCKMNTMPLPIPPAASEIVA